MKRRSFILLTGLGISAIGVSSLKFLGLDFSDKYGYAKPRLLSHLCDEETLQLLGHAYLNRSPDERNENALMTTLYGRVIQAQSLQRHDIKSLREQTESSIKKDFAAGRTIVLDGWVLSITEARQCALYSILNS